MNGECSGCRGGGVQCESEGVYRVRVRGVYSVRGSMTTSLKSTSSQPGTEVSEEPHVFSLHQRTAGPV